MGSLKIKRKPLTKGEKASAIANFMEDSMIGILATTTLDDARIIALTALCRMNLTERMSRRPMPEEITAAVAEAVAEWNKKQAEFHGNAQ